MDHDPHMISDQASLRAMYGESAVEAKKVPELTPSTVAALQLAPFFVLSTADANGRCDASPVADHQGSFRSSTIPRLPSRTSRATV